MVSALQALRDDSEREFDNDAYARVAKDVADGTFDPDMKFLSSLEAVTARNVRAWKEFDRLADEVAPPVPLPEMPKSLANDNSKKGKRKESAEEDDEPHGQREKKRAKTQPAQSVPSIAGSSVSKSKLEVTCEDVLTADLPSLLQEFGFEVQVCPVCLFVRLSSQCMCAFTVPLTLVG